MPKLSKRLTLALLFTLVGCAQPASQSARIGPPAELFRAAGRGDLIELKNATDEQINSATQLGTTLLMVAARRGRSNSVDYLLARGANPNLADMHKQTALHYALSVRNFKIHHSLLKAGADPSAADHFGVTPALNWAEEGYFDLLAIALQNKNSWCCYAQIKKEMSQAISESAKKRKRVRPAVFLILRDLEDE